MKVGSSPIRCNRVPEPNPTRDSAQQAKRSPRSNPGQAKRIIMASVSWPCVPSSESVDPDLLTLPYPSHPRPPPSPTRPRVGHQLTSPVARIDFDPGSRLSVRLLTRLRPLVWSSVGGLTSPALAPSIVSGSGGRFLWVKNLNFKTKGELHHQNAHVHLESPFCCARCPSARPLATRC